jgi:hypothetical protein
MQIRLFILPSIYKPGENVRLITLNEAIYIFNDWNCLKCNPQPHLSGKPHVLNLEVGGIAKNKLTILYASCKSNFAVTVNAILNRIQVRKKRQGTHKGDGFS